MKGGLWSHLSAGRVEGWGEKTKGTGRGQVGSGLTLETRVKELIGKMSTGMKQLTHVPGCKELWGEWAVFACGFVTWWVDTRLMQRQWRSQAGVKGIGGAGEEGAWRGAPVELKELTRVLQEAETQYGSLVEEYTTLVAEREEGGGVGAGGAGGRVGVGGGGGRGAGGGEGNTSASVLSAAVGNDGGSEGKE